MTYRAPKKHNHILGAAQAIAFSLLAANSAHAVDAAWNGLSDNSWQNSGNWSIASIPGATSGYASTDTVTFGTTGNGTIALGGTVNIQNIVFGGGGQNASAFTIGEAGDALHLTNGGSINITGGVTANQTIGVAGGSINLSDSTGATYSFVNNGIGSLNVAAEIQPSVASTLTLGGIGSSTISGSLASGAINIVKNGSGTWTLSGANSSAGTATVNGGTLIYDFTANTPVNSTSIVKITNGTLAFKGKSSGATSATVGTLDLTGKPYLTSNTLKLDANDGAGVNLTINTLACSIDSPAASILIDTSSSSANTINVGGISTSSTTNYVGVSNGVLMVGSAAARRANIIVHDAGGYGFATLSGATSGTIGRLTTGTDLTASSSSNTSNFFYSTAGTLTRTAALDYSTITIDSSAGAITLDLGSYSLAATGSGRATLITGNNDVTFAGSGNLGASTSSYFYNYGTGMFTLAQNSNAGTVAMVFGGTGLINYTGTLGGLTTGFELATLVRMSNTQNLSTNASRFIVANGVLEVGANLSNGSAAGDFINSVGVATNGRISFRGDSGVSAYGGYRTVSFGGATPQALTWGASGFLTNADDITDGNYAFKLSSDKSDSTVEVKNSIALGANTTRVVDVADGSAATDAVLSGTLSGSGSILKKTGEGTLALTGINTYDGGTIVAKGTLAVNGSLAAGVSVASGATLDNNGMVKGNVDVSGSLKGGGTVDGNLSLIGGTFSPGNSPGITTVTGDFATDAASKLVLEVTGTTPGTGGYDQIEVGGNITLAGTLDLTTLSGLSLLDSIILIENIGSGTTTGFFSEIITSGATYTFTTSSPTYMFNIGGTGYLLNYAAQAGSDGQFNDVTLTVVPEPSTWAMLVGGLGLLAFGQRMRRAKM